MALNPEQLQQVDALPSDWELIPTFTDKGPAPVSQGSTMRIKWQARSWNREQLEALNGTCFGVGVKLGPVSGGLLVMDYDAREGDRNSAIRCFEETFGYGWDSLPETVAWTSGKPGRAAVAFVVPMDWWDEMPNRRTWGDADGDLLEARFRDHYSVVIGAHPDTEGYRYLPGRSPDDVQVAEAPEWLLEIITRREEIKLATPSSGDAARAVEMLKFISTEENKGYAKWLRVGIALHHTDDGLLEAWTDWSRQMDNFDSDEVCLKKWQSFKERKGGLSIASLHEWAKAGGYKEPKAKPSGGAMGDLDEELLPLSERITNRIQELLDAHLANIPSDIDAAFAELYKLGVARDRAEERILMLWADSHGLDISTGSKPRAQHRGRVLGKAKEGKGLRQQLPGFGIDNDLHLLVSDAGGGKTTAFCELVTVMTARDKGFLDHEAPRTDPVDDPRTTALVIASDGESSAYSMWEDYIDSISGLDRGANVEIWAQDDDTGEASWNVSLHNLERLIKRMAEGDVAVVVMDTANSILRGAGVNTGFGPVEVYLRLLKQIVCKHAPLWISQHTNRGGGTTMKSIGGHPAFQEVPSVIHLIEAKEQADGTKMRVWHVLKLRGCPYRRFSYELREGELKVTDGHFFENCREQLLVLLHKQILGGGFTAPGDLIRLSGRPAQSVYSALGELRSLKLIRARGRGYRITAAGERWVESLRVATEADAPEGPEWV